MANPVLVNDLRRSLLRRKPVNVVVYMAIAILVLTLSSTMAIQVRLTQYVPIWNLPDLLLPIVVPAFAAGSFAREHEQRTWDDVLLMRLGAWEIIRGKFLGCLLPTLVAIIVLFPPFSMLLIVQGVNWALDFGPWIFIVIVKFLISAFFYISLVMVCSYFCNAGRTALIASYVLLAGNAFANGIIWLLVVPQFYDAFIGADASSSTYRMLHPNYDYESSKQFSLSPIEVTRIAQALVFGMLCLLFLRWRLGKRG